VGPVTARRLRAHGIEKVTDVRTRSVADLQQLVGSAAEWLHALAHGIDTRPVEPNRPRKSVGSENTFASDLTDRAVIRRAVDGMARDVAGWLTRKGIYGRTVTLKVRYDDFSTITRSDSSEMATQDADAIAARAVGLLDRTDAGSRPVRLLGVSVHNLRTGPAAEAPLAAAARLPFEDR
jgi:DNA polymerase-4